MPPENPVPVPNGGGNHQNGKIPGLFPREAMIKSHNGILEVKNPW
jgi:hypothetical protein